MQTLSFLRSDYFKTALDTAVGEKKESIEVEECPFHVLAIIIDFIYGTEIPDDISLHDAKTLLGMADLYLMEDLKDAVSPLIAKRLTNSNLFETFQLGNMFNAPTLKGLCVDFLIKAYVHKNEDFVRKVRSANLGTFKSRADFVSSEEYEAYMTSSLQLNMIVVVVAGSDKGDIGQVVRFSVDDDVVVKWADNGLYFSASIQNLEILTPPINMKMFSELLTVANITTGSFSVSELGKPSF